MGVLAGKLGPHNYDANLPLAQPLRNSVGCQCVGESKEVKTLHAVVGVHGFFYTFKHRPSSFHFSLYPAFLSLHMYNIVAQCASANTHKVLSTSQKG